MSLILSIETATTVCSVALYNGGTLLGSQSLFIDKSHSGLLAPSIETLMRYCGYQFDDLQAVAVSEGPGSYTGLRIGLSGAKGLCYALNIPLIAVNTLYGMAYGLKKFNTEGYFLCPMIDARRMEVYCMVTDSQLNIIKDTEAVVVDENFLNETLQTRNVLFFGNGAGKCKSVITVENAKFLNGICPDAVNIGAVAWEKYNKGEFEDVAYFEPAYLKEFKAGKPKKVK